MQIEADALDGMHAACELAEQTAAHRKTRDEIAYAEDWLCLLRCCRCLVAFGKRLLCMLAVELEQRKLRGRVRTLHRAELRHGREQRFRISVRGRRKQLRR